VRNRRLRRDLDQRVLPRLRLLNTIRGG